MNDGNEMTVKSNHRPAVSLNNNIQNLKNKNTEKIYNIMTKH
jgi:hypothetical protein